MHPDFQQLQGDWLQTSFEKNGVVDPPDSHGAPGAVMSIRGAEFHVTGPTGEILVAGRFALGTTGAPKAIDWVDSTGEDAGKVIAAIYELGLDCFAFAAADPGQPRPRGFSGGPGITIRSFARRSPERG